MYPRLENTSAFVGDGRSAEMRYCCSSRSRERELRHEQRNSALSYLNVMFKAKSDNDTHGLAKGLSFHTVKSVEKSKACYFFVEINISKHLPKRLSNRKTMS